MALGDSECVENYVATCAYITALCEDSDATQFVIAGDFNCDFGSRYYADFQNFIADNNLCMSDSNRLSGVATYYNDAGTANSWIDHLLCSPVINGLIGNMEVREDFVSSQL